MSERQKEDDLLDALASLDHLISERERRARALCDEDDLFADQDEEPEEDIPVLSDVVAPGDPRLARLHALETEVDRLVAERLERLREPIKADVLAELHQRYPHLF